MAELFDAEGNKVEAFTPEEVEEKIEAVKEEIEEQLEELKEAKTEIEDQVKEKEEMIEELQRQIEEGSGDKGMNFAKLRKTKEALEQENKELKEKLAGVDDKIEGVKKEIDQKITSEKIEGKISKMAGGDEELAKKIKHYFNNFKPVEESDPEKRAKIIEEQLKSAFTLATGGQTAGIGATGLAGTGGEVHIPSTPKPGEKITPDVKEFGKKRFGLTDDDFKAAGLE